MVALTDMAVRMIERLIGDAAEGTCGLRIMVEPGGCAGLQYLLGLESAAMDDGTVGPGAGSTELFITPGFRFRAVDALLTNFHLPRSTLLMLVCAFAGREPVLEAYREAVAQGYRFYSYGDAMLLERAGVL